jgi:hypothetical protein
MDKITIKSVNFLSDDTALTDNSSGLVPTQHAVKAYVDANSGGGTTTFLTVTSAEAANGADNDICYVVETDTFYRYESSGSAYTDNNTSILSTGEGGNTRWLAVAGKYTITSPILSGVFRNAIINGNMDIAQRGTTFTGPSSASGAYLLDRYKVLYNVGGSLITRDTDVPNTLSKCSMKMDCTSTNTSLDAGDYFVFVQAVEGYNFFPYVGRTATLSFWVKATKTGTYCVSFVNFGADRSYVAEYTVNTTNTWERKTITLTFNYSGGTWNYTNGVGISVYFTLVSGGTFQTTANTWQTGLYYATSNQVNGLNSTANNFWVTQIQLNDGLEALPFQPLSFEENLKQCQRYFYKSHTYSSTLTASGIASGLVRVSFNTSDFFDGVFNLPTPMRAVPTITYYSPITGTINKLRDVTSTVDISAATTAGGTESCPYVYCNGSGMTANHLMYGNITAQAEL